MRGETARRMLVAATLVAAALGCDGASRSAGRDPDPDPDLVPGPEDAGDLLPRRSLDGVDPPVRVQLEGEEATLRGTLARAGATAAERAEAWGRLGTFYHAYDLLQAAEACYRRAAELAPDDLRWPVYLGSVAERQGRFPAAREILEQVAARTPDDAAVRLRLGRIALRLGEPETAERHFEAALGAAGDCWAARFGLGEVARDEGDLEAAIDHYRAVLRAQPGAAQVHYPLAQALLRAGRGGEARPHLDAVAARPVDVGGRPSCPDPLDALLAERTTGAAAHVRRSQQARLAGNLERELVELEQAVALAPDDPAILGAFGSALLRAERFEEAAAVFERAGTAAPDDPEPVRGRVGALLRLGRTGAAAAVLEPALARFPGEATLWSQAAVVRAAGGDAAGALAAFDRVLALDPAATGARVGRAMTLAGLGRRDEAARELELALDGPGSSSPEERLRIAGALLGLGGRDRALAELRRLAADPEAPEPVRLAARQALGG